MNHPAAPFTSTMTINQEDRLGGWVMMGALVVGVLLALVLGAANDQIALAAALALVLGGLGFAAQTAAGQHLSGRAVVVFALVGLVALHIHLGRGNLLFHFGVFVSLGLVMVYRDWRLVILTAGLFAVHHVLFDRLQAMGLGLYCLSQPSFTEVLGHAGYVVAQAVPQAYMAAWMGNRVAEGTELRDLVTRLRQGGRIRLDMQGTRATSDVSKGLRDLLEQLRSTIAQVQQSAVQIAAASQEIASGNQDLSQRTEQAASNLEQTAAGMEELSGTVASSASSAREASGLADTAAAVAHKGGDMVQQIVNTMQEIQESSRRIANIIGTIDGIAFQTNILALNAAVEAARAGEQGRGFAVVASEVRALAGRSAEAAREIKSLIGASVDRIESGTTLVAQTGTTMRDLVESVQRVSVIMGQINSGAQQQALGIGEVHSAVGQLDQMTQQNAALVEQAAAAASSLRDEARRLEQAVSQFDLGGTSAAGTTEHLRLPR